MSEKKRKQQELDPSFTKKSKTSQATVQSRSSGSNEGTIDTGGHPTFDESAALSAFQELLDFSLVETEAEIATRFNLIAKTLLCDFTLVARGRDAQEVGFRILEAEFYLQMESIHEDPFTHGGEEQRFSGQWYFHRAPMTSKDSNRSLTSLTGYRGGSRKGMDITFGGPPLNNPSASISTIEGGSSTTAPSPPRPELKNRRIRGGILLRSMRQVNNSKVISGPSLLVDQILTSTGTSTIKELVESQWQGNKSAFLSHSNENATVALFIRPLPGVKAASSIPPIYFSPRIGLDLSHPGTTSPTVLPLHPRIQFLPRRYRFFVHPEMLVANGRPQTFLGVVYSVIASFPTLTEGLKKQKLSQEISSLTGLKESTSAKYLADFAVGRTEGNELLQSFIGSKGKGAASSPSTYLKMMGALTCLE